jgi:hypothetical protein
MTYGYIEDLKFSVEVFDERGNLKNDDDCLVGGAHDPTCGNANVHPYGRTKRKCHRVHPQPKRGELVARHVRPLSPQ